MVCVCCGPPAQQCCCDDAGIRILQGDDECANEPFPVPDPAKSATVVFEWCGLTGVDAMQGDLNSYFDDEVIDLFVCNTTGRYGPEDSYTRATRKALSVFIPSEGGGGVCGYQKSFLVSGQFEGTGYRLLGGDYVPWESPITSETYDCTVYQCFDGSAAVVTMNLSGNTTDDTCGGAGNFDPCKFTAPEVTVVVAP